LKIECLFGFLRKATKPTWSSHPTVREVDEGAQVHVGGRAKRGSRSLQGGVPQGQGSAAFIPPVISPESIGESLGVCCVLAVTGGVTAFGTVGKKGETNKKKKKSAQTPVVAAMVEWGLCLGVGFVVFVFLGDKREAQGVGLT